MLRPQNTWFGQPDLVYESAMNLALTLTVLAIALGARAYINRGQTWGTPDEKTYTIYASKWRPGARFAEYVDRFLLFPPQVPPVRYGFIGLCAALVALLKTDKAFQVVTWVAAVSGAVAAPIAYLITDSVWAALLVGSSPLSLMLSRRALQDTFGALTLLVSLYGVHLHSPWLYTGGLALAIASREATLLYVPSLFIAWGLATGSWLAGGIGAATSITIAVAGFYLLGGRKLVPLFRKHRELTDYVRRFQSGAPHRVLVDLVLMSPVAFVAAAYAAPNAPAWVLGFVVAGLATHAGVRPKNVRFMLASDLGLRLLCAWFPWGWQLFVCCLIVDVLLYRTHRYSKDPVTYNLLVETGIYKEK